MANGLVMIDEAERRLHAQVVARSRALLRDAERHFARALPAPEIRFDLRGQAAGQARLGPNRVSQLRYNPRLLAENAADFLAQTVPHEVAHLVAFEVFGARIRPHGAEWRAVMQLFGVVPRRCHGYAVESGSRRLSRYLYRCACRAHELTSIRHNRIRKGQRYYCRSCGQLLVPGQRQATASERDAE